VYFIFMVIFFFGLVLLSPETEKKKAEKKSIKTSKSKKLKEAIMVYSEKFANTLYQIFTNIFADIAVF